MLGVQGEVQQWELSAKRFMNVGVGSRGGRPSDCVVQQAIAVVLVVLTCVPLPYDIV